MEIFAILALIGPLVSLLIWAFMLYCILQISKSGEVTAAKVSYISDMMKDVPSTKFAADSIDEQRKQNELLRQLIRTNGHEPVA